MLGGNGGKADAATTGLVGVSVVVVGLTKGLEGTDILRIPGWARFSFFGAVGGATACAGVVCTEAFLAAGVDGGFAMLDLVGTVAAGVFAVPELKAGKSSDCNC